MLTGSRPSDSPGSEDRCGLGGRTPLTLCRASKSPRSAGQLTGPLPCVARDRVGPQAPGQLSREPVSVQHAAHFLMLRQGRPHVREQGEGFRGGQGIDPATASPGGQRGYPSAPCSCLWQTGHEHLAQGPGKQGQEGTPTCSQRGLPGEAQGQGGHSS